MEAARVRRDREIHAVLKPSNPAFAPRLEIRLTPPNATLNPQRQTAPDSGHPRNSWSGEGQMKRLVLFTTTALGLALLLLYGCRDTTEVTGPSTAVTAATYTLIVSGSNTGSGVVKSTPTGISCTITNGQAASTGCAKAFPRARPSSLPPIPRPARVRGLAQRPGPQEPRGLLHPADVRPTSRRYSERDPSPSRSPAEPPAWDRQGQEPGRAHAAMDCLITNGTPAATGCSATYRPTPS